MIIECNKYLYIWLKIIDLYTTFMRLKFYLDKLVHGFS